MAKVKDNNFFLYKMPGALLWIFAAPIAIIIAVVHSIKLLRKSQKAAKRDGDVMVTRTTDALDLPEDQD